MHAKSLLNFVSTQKRKNLSFARLLSFDDTGSKDGRDDGGDAVAAADDEDAVPAAELVEEETTDEGASNEDDEDGEDDEDDRFRGGGGGGGDRPLPSDDNGPGGSAVLEGPSDEPAADAADTTPGASAEDIERLKRMFGSS